MSLMTMTLPALYDYAKTCNGIDIFDGVVLGTNIPNNIDKTTLIDNILVQSAPFEVLYSNPAYLHSAVTTWFNTHSRTFLKWGKALDLKYDPLNNYDRTEISSDSEFESNTNNEKIDDLNTNIKNIQNSITENNSNSNSGLESNNYSNNSKNSGNNNTIESENRKTDSTSTDSVSAYDSSSWSNANRKVDDASEKSSHLTAQNNSGNVNENGNRTILQQNNSSSALQNDNLSSNVENDIGQRSLTNNGNRVNDKKHELRAYGNIGVTTSQQMLQSELDIALWNIYTHITDMFIEEFCIMLY